MAGDGGGVPVAAEPRGAVAVPAGSGGAVPGQVVRGGFARLALALAGAAVLASVVSLLAQRVVTRLARFVSGDGSTTFPSPTPSYVGTAVLTAVVVVLVASALAVCVRRRWWRGTEVVAVAAVAGLATVLLAVPLAGTRLYLGGNSVDQMFRTQFLGRLADDWHLADMNYADLPSFYPSGWFWLAGRFADLTSTPAWQAFKPAAIVTSAIVPCLALVAWSRLVGPRRGLLIGFATVAVGVYPALAGAFVDEPYSWCLAAFVPLTAVVAWRAFGDVSASRRRAAALAIGVVLGAGAMTYTLYAGFAAVVVALACAVRTAQAWRAGEGSAAVRTRVPALVLTAVVSGLLAALVWAPYVVSVLTTGGGRAAAQHFLPLISAQLPTPMFAATPWGAFLLLGLVRLVLALRSDPDARPLLLVVALAYLWYLLSTLALVLRTTLLAFRMESIVVETLAVAGVLGGAAAWRRLPALAAAVPALAGRRTEVRALVVLVAAAVLVVPLQQTGQALAAPVTKAYTDDQADGRDALGQEGTGDGAWTDELLAALDQVSDGQPADQRIVLTAYYELASFSPFRGFQQVTPHYANPLSDYDARRAEVQRWAAATSAADLLQRLDSSPFPAPGQFVLRRGADGYEVGLAADAFPAEPNVRWTTVVFRPALFDDPAFTTVDVGPFVVVGRTGAPAAAR